MRNRDTIRLSLFPVRGHFKSERFKCRAQFSLESLLIGSSLSYCIRQHQSSAASK